jgi:hypothetical protein
MRKRVTLLFAALAMVLTISFSGVAFAKIQSVDTSGTHGGRNQPGGLQPTCQGGGLTQQKGAFSRLGLIPQALAFLFALFSPECGRQILRSL